ncbi:hypothetical protein KI387_024180, partial [Taxus chinensis]
ALAGGRIPVSASHQREDLDEWTRTGEARISQQKRLDEPRFDVNKRIDSYADRMCRSLTA